MKYIEMFIKAKSRKLEENTLKGYESDLNVFFNRIMYDYSLNEDQAINFITPEYVEKYLEENKQMVREKKYSSSSLNRQLASLTSFYDYLKDTLYKVEINPFKHIDRFTKLEDKKKTEVLTLEETKRVLKETYVKHKGERMYKFSSARNRFLIALMSSTGMRINEVLNIEKKFIKQSGENYIIEIPANLCKNHEGRYIPICGLTKEYYHEYLIEREKLNVDSDLLFISNRKKPMFAKDTMKAIQKYCSYINIDKDICNHSFRHVFRTQAVKNNVNESLICLIGGWSRKKLGNQSDIYLHDSPELNDIKIKVCEKIL